MGSGSESIFVDGSERAGDRVGAVRSGGDRGRQGGGSVGIHGGGGGDEGRTQRGQPRSQRQNQGTDSK